MSTKKVLKVFVDGYLLNKEHQGTKTYIKELYKEFARQNPTYLIYIGCFKNKIIELEFNEFNNIRFIYFKQKIRGIRMLFEIPNIISEYSFDFAHFQYVIPFIKSKKCKYIVTIHDILFNDFKHYFSVIYRIKRNFLFKLSAKRSDILLTVSDYSKIRIKEFYQIHNKEIFITPNGVSTTFFNEYNKKESQDYILNKYNVKNYLLYVSRVEPRKNQQVLLKILPHLDNLNIIFIGSKTINNQILDNQYQKLPKSLQNRVYFFDNIQERDLIEFYRGAEVFVYPTLAEGFGIPPLEAAAVKIPVICANNTALLDFNFFKPYLIDVNNLGLLQNKLNEILRDNDKERLKNIQNTIKIKYSWKNSSKILFNSINNHF